ncbi:ubiquitin carboxyl-terminal hydrolase 14 [Pieris napi]|uniref:ubiquitin carboxyl-terminal hydrolase 14 n=1 Tax=Pieris napi TaxID=78633 RepID=UPI001FBB6305|nr:ubiquitin carboxyl-terminal hydrolase 14 [Pieris napi]
MPKVSVKVKWGKELFKDVEVNTDDDPVVFKAQIFALTGVQPERQKVVCKGVTLRDDSWANFKLSNNALVLVMGSKEEDLPTAPVEKTKFVEDMNESELATALDLPEGLINLGNTCYMNATVQCLKTVPELRNALLDYDPTSGGGTAGGLTAALSDTMKNLESGGPGACAASVSRLLLALHAAAPRLAERGAGGVLAQQDASECWTEIVRALRARLPMPGSDSKSVIEKYFGGTLDVEWVCSEAEEPSTKSEESFLQLSCFISQDVKYLQSGLRSKMVEQITKMSESLGRDAVYTKTSKISRLPAYLTVQFVRFYFKEKEAINAKILKDVKFPLDLDVYELCSPELQERLTPMRNKFKELDDALVQQSLPARNKNQGDNKDLRKKKLVPYWFENDIGSNNSGFYRLQAVLTHRGRSSSSGHYVAWVARGDSWLRCDDDTVTPVSEEEVLKLSGGGDWHCAYLLLYGPRVLEIPEEDEEPMVTDVTDDMAGNPPTALA